MFVFVFADDELPELPIEHGMLDKLKQRIVVARKIDAANHKVKKDNHEKSWIKEAAEALEIDIDSDNMLVDAPSLDLHSRPAPFPSLFLDSKLTDVFLSFSAGLRTTTTTKTPEDTEETPNLTLSRSPT